MADRKPIYISSTGLKTVFQTGDTLAVAHGGTGATTASDARTNLGLVIGTHVQGWDADLDAIAALSGTGIAVRSTTNTWVQRTLVAPAAGISISNASGAGGDPTFSLANDLAALEGLGSTGFAVRDNTDSWVQRSIATASSSRIDITNGNGVSGNPTIDLATVSNSGTGTFVKINIDSYGRVTGTAAVATSDITTLVDATYVNVNGDTLTGYLTAHADPTNALHLATKQYVDAVSAGYSGNKTAVRVASTANVTVSNPGTATFDGVTLTSGVDYILLKDQSAPEENGVYLFNGSGSALTRSAGYNVSAEVMPGLFVFVSEGTSHGDQGFTLTTNAPITLDTTGLVFTQTSGAGQITAGSGLTKTGNTINIGTAATSRIVVNADDIDLGQPSIGGSGATSGITKVTVDVYGRVTNTGTATPGDIGAQPVDADLTAIAALTSTGIAVRYDVDSWVLRSIATASSSRITVTNGSGAGGNPTLDLASGVVSPGTYNSVTVDTYGRVTAGTTSAATNLSDSFTNAHGSTISIGQVVYSSASGSVALAKSDALGTSRFVGIVGSSTIANTATGSIYVEGIITATTGEWDAVTGQSGGLTSGSVYFLSGGAAGALTTTAPTTGFLVPVGVAVSTTRFKLFSPDIIQL